MKDGDKLLIQLNQKRLEELARERDKARRFLVWILGGK